MTSERAIAATADATDHRAEPPGRPLVAARERFAALAAVTLGAIAIAADKASTGFDTDGWWRMRAGDLMLDEHRIPRADDWSWTAAGQAWRLNGYLFDVLAAALRRAGGRPAVSAMVLVGVIAFALVIAWIARRNGARPWPAALVALLVTYVTTPFAAERPQTVSMILFPIALYLARSALDDADRSRANRSLWQLAFLVAIWSNLHLTFSAAIATIGLIAACDVVRQRRLVRPMLVAGVSGLAGLCNPYGIAAYTASLNVRSASKAAGIAEWQAIDPRNLPQACALLIVVLTAVALWRTGRWRRIDVVIPATVILVLTVDARRNIPFLMAILAPELALGASQLRLRRLRRWARPRREPITVGLLAGMLALTVMGVLSVDTVRSAAGYPAAAVDAIPSDCRLLNEYAQGGFILDRRHDVLVSMDGRNDMYGTDRVREQQDVLAADGDWQEWLDSNEVDCVLARPGRELVAALQAEGWQTIVAEENGVLLQRPEPSTRT